MSWLSKAVKKLGSMVLKNSSTRGAYYFGVFYPFNIDPLVWGVGIMQYNLVESEIERIEELQMQGIYTILDPDVTRIQRYAPYLEEYHLKFLDLVFSNSETAINNSPFSSYEDVSVDDILFGVGNSIADNASMFGKFKIYITDFEGQILWETLFESVLSDEEIVNDIEAELRLKENKMIEKELRPLCVSARDVNSVNSSSFIISRSLLECKNMADGFSYSAEAKYKILPEVMKLWKAYISWNIIVLNMYAQLMKLYYLALFDMIVQSYEMRTKNTLWPFTIIDKDIRALNALRGAFNLEVVQATLRGYISPYDISTLVMSNAIMWALRGFSLGNQISPGWGGLIGGVVGGVIGAGMGIYDTYEYLDTRPKFNPFYDGLKYPW